MTKDNVTGYWTATVANARPNHEYKYFVRWSGNGNGTWKQYPRAVWVRGDTSVSYDHAAFNWGTTARPAVSVDRQGMYELHIGSFHDPDPNDGRPGTFDDAIARLDYLRRLGINVIALMTVNEFGSDYIWGYNPEHIFAIVFARSPASSGVSTEDADGNGLANGWEAMTGVSDPDGDADGDGISNLREYQHGFDPLAPDPTTAAPASQVGVPTGFQRREVSVPMSGEALFLRLRVTAP